MRGEVPIEVGSIFGLMTGEPIVEFRCGREELQMSPAQAREVAGMLYESAEAAEGDAAFCHALSGMGMLRADIAKMRSCR